MEEGLGTCFSWLTGQPSSGSPPPLLCSLYLRQRGDSRTHRPPGTSEPSQGSCTRCEAPRATISIGWHLHPKQDSLHLNISENEVNKKNNLVSGFIFKDKTTNQLYPGINKHSALSTLIPKPPCEDHFQ